MTLQFSMNAKGIKYIYQNICTHVHIAARTGNTEESIRGFLKTVVCPYGRVSTQPLGRRELAACAVRACSLISREAEAEAAERQLRLYRKTLPQKQARQNK